MANPSYVVRERQQYGYLDDGPSNPDVDAANDASRSPRRRIAGLPVCCLNSDRGGTPQLYVMNIDGSNVRRISFGRGRYGHRFGRRVVI